MSDETTIIPKEQTTSTTTTVSAGTDSKVFNVSVRGWIAVFVVSTVCACAIMRICVTEPLYTLSVAIVSFYYGQNFKKP
jgi:hypothetical protein